MGKGDGASPVLDRSNVRILLCDKDPNNTQEVLELLRKCSYQVIAVATAREVIGFLNAESDSVDLILAEVDLPQAKGFKMLKYITREKSLRRIPIVMMSAQDEVSVVMKCLKLGAADYLVKPLRINELLNLWIHMWRRRRMLGLAEKRIIGKSLIHDLDLLVSDGSESNTNSTTLFSDDTDDRKVKSHTGPETSTLATPECEPKDCPGLELSLKRSSDVTSEALDAGPLRGIFSCPRKSELKLGVSSAFLTYVKTDNQTSKTPKINGVHENLPAQHQMIPQKQNTALLSSTNASKGTTHSAEGVKPPMYNEAACDGNCRESFENKSSNLHHTHDNTAREQYLTVQMPVNTEGQKINGPGASSFTPSHPFVSGMGNHSQIPSSAQLCQGMPHDIGPHVSPGMVPFHALQPCQGVPVNAAISYYPFGLHVAPGQLGPSRGWAPMLNMSVTDPKLSQIERREAALNKFRQKRKDRCFDKKIRYVSRKRLAEQRPRIRGQFVRQTSDMEAGGNMLVDGADDSDEEDDDYGQGSSELGPESSPESVARES